MKKILILALIVRSIAFSMDDNSSSCPSGAHRETDSLSDLTSMPVPEATVEEYNPYASYLYENPDNVEAALFAIDQTELSFDRCITPPPPLVLELDVEKILSTPAQKILINDVQPSVQPPKPAPPTTMVTWHVETPEAASFASAPEYELQKLPNKTLKCPFCGALNQKGRRHFLRG